MSDASSLANAIRDLLADPAKTRLMANRGFKTAMEEFGLMSFLEKIERINSETISEYPPHYPA
jgi:hypothetical protein